MYMKVLVRTSSFGRNMQKPSVSRLTKQMDLSVNGKRDKTRDLMPFGDYRQFPQWAKMNGMNLHILTIRLTENETRYIMNSPEMITLLVDGCKYGM